MTEELRNSINILNSIAMSSFMKAAQIANIIVDTRQDIRITLGPCSDEWRDYRMQAYALCIGYQDAKACESLMFCNVIRDTTITNVSVMNVNFTQEQLTTFQDNMASEFDAQLDQNNEKIVDGLMQALGQLVDAIPNFKNTDRKTILENNSVIRQELKSSFSSVKLQEMINSITKSQTVTVDSADGTLIENTVVTTDAVTTVVTRQMLDNKVVRSLQTALDIEITQSNLSKKNGIWDTLWDMLGKLGYVWIVLGVVIVLGIIYLLMNFGGGGGGGENSNNNNNRPRSRSSGSAGQTIIIR